MSELNKKDKNNYDATVKDFTSKTKTIVIRIIIGLVFFAIICTAVTAGAIYFALSNKEPIESGKNNNYKDSKIEKITDTVKGIESFTDIYNENDLIIEEIDIASSIPNHTPNYAYIVKISGLKNESVEKKINEDIKNTARALISSYSDADEISLYTYVTANFSDILSINLYLSCYHENKYKNDELSLNYRLDTGEKIKFDDIFIDSANIKSIIAPSIYIGLVRQYAFDDAGDTMETMDLKSKDYSFIEDELFKLLSIYNKKGISEFYISNKYISFEINGNSFSIFMPDYYKDIAIFNRFKSDVSLYKEKNIGIKNLYIFMGDRPKGDLSFFKDYSDNMFVDILFFFSEYEEYAFSEEEKSDLVKKATDILDEFKAQAKLSQDKGFAYIGMVHAYKDSSGNMVVSFELTSHEMSLTFYKSDFQLLLATEYAFERWKPYLGPIHFTNKNLKTSDMFFDFSTMITQPEEIPDDLIYDDFQDTPGIDDQNDDA